MFERSPYKPAFEQYNDCVEFGRKKYNNNKITF